MFHHRLTNVATQVVAMSTEFSCVLLDLDSRQATPIPDDIRAAIGEHFLEPAKGADS